MQQYSWRRAAWTAIAVALLVGMVTAFVACSPAPGSVSAQPQGTLSGTVVAGPTCPVERADQPCPPRPVPNRQVMIETASGTVVTRATTDQNGHFLVTLAPGTYEVRVPPGTSPFPIQRERQAVTIVAGQTVQIQIELDTGIR
jgi:hypothetical protein